jgi:hypothetical protein
LKHAPAGDLPDRHVLGELTVGAGLNEAGEILMEAGLTDYLAQLIEVGGAGEQSGRLKRRGGGGVGDGGHGWRGGCGERTRGRRDESDQEEQSKTKVGKEHGE